MIINLWQAFPKRDRKSQNTNHIQVSSLIWTLLRNMPLRQFSQSNLHTDIQTEWKFGLLWQSIFILIIWLQPPVITLGNYQGFRKTHYLLLLSHAVKLWLPWHWFSCTQNHWTKFCDICAIFFWLGWILETNIFVLKYGFHYTDSH